jgi:hypothetical protein
MIIQEIMRMPLFLNSEITPAKFAKCEISLLDHLNWRTLVPTSTETINLFLFVINPSQDLPEIKEGANNLIALFRMRYDLV